MPTGLAPWGPILPGKDYWTLLMSFLLLGMPLKSRPLQGLGYQYRLQSVNLSLHRNRMSPWVGWENSLQPRIHPRCFNFQVILVQKTQNRSLPKGKGSFSYSALPYSGFNICGGALDGCVHMLHASDMAIGLIIQCFSYRVKEKLHIGFPEWNCIFIKQGHTFGPGSSNSCN